MKKMIKLFAVLGMVLALAPAANAQTTSVVPFGYAGDYRIIFTTSGTYDAVPTDIATYNGRVQTAAAATSGNAIDLSGVSGWKMIGSTAAMNAKANTGTLLSGDGGYSAANDVPIYNVNGVRVADDNAALWGTSHAPYINYPPYWEPQPDSLLAPILRIDGGVNGARIWTGTAADGSSHVGNELGTPGAGNVVSQGRGNGRYDAAWISEGPNGNPNPSANPYNHHALSPVLTAVAPTVATILISGSSTLIYPGDTTPNLADDTDFGSVIMGGADIVKTYTVTNFGTVGTLTLTDPATVTGGGGRFAVGALTATVLVPGGAATFTVTYTAHSSARSVDDATVSLVSDATDNDPYEFAITATTTNDGVIAAPGDGYTGPYRIAFVTTGTTNATSTVIADYNAFVTTAAAGVTELNDLGVEWTCLGSTKTVSAKTNTSTHTTGDANDVPIYTTTGQLIATNNADLWDGNIDHAITYEDGGTVVIGNGRIWTGTESNGDISNIEGGTNELGEPNFTGGKAIRFGTFGSTSSDWIAVAATDRNQAFPYLALSSVIIPPPPGMVLIIR
ncbi:MAG: hypothetical protein HN383_16495 [Verrucomicrobia bacterium]|nr:hypothetical protein [Verrucomicrobiota bacterium]MBT7701915.1 hypothetical protein [Verrucomicrobiota bacterium]